MFMNLINLIWIIPIGALMAFVIHHLAEILPIYRKIIVSPVCISCEQKFKLSDYLLNRNCIRCNAKPSQRKYILVILFIITYVLLYIFPPNYTGTFIAIVIFTFLSLVFVIDLEHKLILHPVSIFGAILFLILGYFLNGLTSTLIGGGVGFLIMFSLYLFGILFSKWMAKRRGIEMDEVALGYGDVNLTAILGLLFGWPRIIVLIFFAILFGGLFSAIYLLVLRLKKKYELFTAIPYAPFLIVAAILLLYISTQR